MFSCGSCFPPKKRQEVLFTRFWAFPETVLNSGGMKLNPITLTFSGEDAELEEAYLHRNFDKYVWQVRVVLVFAALVYITLGYLDRLWAPELFEMFLIIRVGFFLPVIFVVLCLSFTPFFIRIMQPLFASVILAGGGCVIMMLSLATVTAGYVYFVGLILVFMFAYSFGRVKFFWASFSSWILIAIALVTPFFFSEAPRQVVFSNTFFFVTANLVGMVSCYMFEYYNRKNFSISCELENERWNARQANLELEHRVQERTSQLATVNKNLREEIEERKKVARELREIHGELELRVDARTRELVRINDELSTAKETADQSARVKTEFLANMSHEIRTPMNAIIGMSDLALNEEISRDQRREYLDIIRTSARSLLGIINDILDLSKIEAGKMELEETPFDLGSLLESIFSMFADQLNEKGLEFILDIESGIPERLVGDPLRFQQVLVNLTSNAIKFTEAGEITLRMSMVEESDTHVVLMVQVADTGIGLETKTRAMLFDAFAQADGSITRKYGGTGLGLTICKRIVEMMGGTIEVASSPGEGSTFTFTCPMGRDSVAPSRPDYAVPMYLQGVDVLVVEGNTTLKDLLVRMLRSFGFGVSSCDGGVESLSMLSENHPYDLIVVDMKLPDMDGVELAKKVSLQGGRKRPHVILLDAFSAGGHPHENGAFGIDRVVSKPLRPSSLFDAIMETFGEEVIPRGSFFRDETESSGNYSAVEGALVLLVEDNRVNQMVATEILTFSGIRVEIAENGLEAIERVKDKAYDAVLMDMQMPQLDGMEATRIIRNELKYTKIPIIAMTAHAMEGDREACLEAGMDDYISKPIDRAKLMEVLSPYLSRPSQSKGDLDFVGESVAAYGEDPPLDIHQGVQRIGGNGKVYRSIVKKFVDLYADRMVEIRAMVHTGDFERASHEVHAIKGASSNISANRLFARATELEARLAEGQAAEVLAGVDALEEAFCDVQIAAAAL